MSKVDGGLSHRAYVLDGKTDQQQGKNQRCVECATCQVMIKHPNKAEINGVQIKYAMAREGWYLGWGSIGDFFKEVT